MPFLDFHAHILPGADHGSDCSATSLSQLELLREAGVTAVVATPHFYPHCHNIDGFCERRARSAAHLARRLTDRHPAVFVGAEVLACTGMENMEGLDRLCVAGTRTLLLELPFSGWGHSLIDTVLQIKENGFHPVLAHIERYARPAIEEFLREGVSAQLNAELFSHPLRHRAYFRYIEGGVVVALGSDLHDAPKSTVRTLMRMRRRLGDAADAVFARTEALLAGAHPLQSVETGADQAKDPLLTT